MNLKAFFTKNWQHIAALGFIFILAAIFFKPQFDGLGLKQHDIEQFKGMSQEIVEYRELYGEEPLWTNSMFGGMPATQISVIYEGNWFSSIVRSFSKLFPPPVGVVLLHLLGFYLLGIFLRIKPIISLIGAVMFSFASYEIIILQAGHNSKAFAVAFLAPTLGAFIASYRHQKWWLVLFAGIFMAFELAMNHLQVTYYFGMLLGLVGIYFFIDAVKQKKIKAFGMVTSGLIGVFLVALLVNSGNIFSTNDYAKHTIRGKNDVTINPDGTQTQVGTTGLDKDYITNWSYGIGETFTLLSPNVKGAGSFYLGDGQFEKFVENADLGSSEKSRLAEMPAYWGNQPGTTGPVYVGVITVLLSVLGLFFLSGGLKWVFFVTTLLAVALSWGKNFMGLTDFFIDYVPGYNKFRTVTIILVIVELCLPVLSILLLQKLIDQREEFVAKRKKFIMVVGGFVVFLILTLAIGLGDNYTNDRERDQYASIEEDMRNNILSMDPAALKSQYNLDVTNPMQVDQFVQQQVDPYYSAFDNLKEVRKEIFVSSMTRSIIFAVLAGLLLIIYLYSAFPAMVLGGGVLALTLLDLVPIAYNYIGDQEQGDGYKHWEEKTLMDYPISANNGDNQILEMEISQNPKLKSKVDLAAQKGSQKAMELGYSGSTKRNFIDSKRFSALNFNTNYRVFDLSGGFSSSNPSYFHKSLGGYHGAKLRNINNVFDFHLSSMNSVVYDMLNVKYFIQRDDKGNVSARPNPTAMGNAWVVKKVTGVASPNDEIVALGKQFKLVNKGSGALLLNGNPVNAITVGSRQEVKYLINGQDTIKVPMPGRLPKGEVALFVQDANGATNLIPSATMLADTANSFQELIQIEVTSDFNPREEVVMLQSEASKLSSTKFSGEGTVKMDTYLPNKMTYTADLKGKQLVVFSEIYYPEDWKVLVDGKEKPILKVDYLLRGVEMEGGKHKIEMIYESSSFNRYGTLALIGSILLIFVLPGIGIYFERKKRIKIVE